jgi:predicted SnoaL-like aldol condensation-catalyzing enzyme
MDTAPDSQQVVRRFMDEVMSGGSLAAADELVAPDFVDHDPLPEQPPGVEGIKRAVRTLHGALGGAFYDLHFQIEDLMAVEDRVVVRWRASGVQIKDFLGLPATNRHVTATGIDILRVVGGKIVERWGPADRLGLAPASADAPAAGDEARAGAEAAAKPAGDAGGAEPGRAAELRAPAGAARSAALQSADVHGRASSTAPAADEVPHGPPGADHHTSDGGEEGLVTTGRPLMDEVPVGASLSDFTADIRYGFIRDVGTDEPKLVRYSEAVTFDPLPLPEDRLQSLTNTRKLAVYEGDIILGAAEEVERWSSDIINPAQSQIPGGEGPVGAAAGIRGERYRWPGGRVPYVIDRNLPNQARVTQAIQHWEQRTPIRFVKRTNEPNYVIFRRGPGCASYVGMQGGPQLIELADGCTTGNVIHEIGHTVGLWHEQSRRDRDRHVRILYQNIRPEMIHNFDQYSSEEGIDLGSYDFGSIMHYGQTAFSRNGQPTIVPLRGEAIGQRDHLSAGDIAGVKAMYPRAAAEETVEAAGASLEEILRAIFERLRPAPVPALGPAGDAAGTVRGGNGAAAGDERMVHLLAGMLPGLVEGLRKVAPHAS